MKNVYYALFFSHIVYGIQVWGTMCDIHLKALQVLQNRIVRLITYNDQFPIIPGPLPASNPIFSKLELLKIKEIFIYSVCRFIHKFLNSFAISNFVDWFKLSTTIHKNQIKSNQIKSNLFTITT